MNSYITILLITCGCVAFSAAQYEHFGGGFSDGYFGTSFGVPSYSSLSAAAARDPRANRDRVFNQKALQQRISRPVLFPPSPATGPLQTSGVVAGASGYGFVPPGSQGPALPRYYYRGFFLRR